MTKYLIKLLHVKNPVVIDSTHYQNHLCRGLKYNWFKEFLHNPLQWEWCVKI